MNLWIVRAGNRGQREFAALEQQKLLPGFLDIGDLSNKKNANEILEQLKQDIPDAKENTLRHYSRQLNLFVNSMTVGDYVILPRKLTNAVAIGTVKGNYRFDENSEYKHSREVRWLDESIPRDKFKQDLRHSFGAFMTVCQITRNSALERVKAFIETGMDPGPELGSYGKTQNIKENIEKDLNEFDETDFQTDIEDVANQQIVSLIKSEFAGHALAELVAEILKTKGFTTSVTSPGPDRGVDILAVRGTLGLGEDRVCVQVKSGDGPANHDVVLRLIGSMSNSEATKGLLVSIGGVNSDAKKELDLRFFTVRLWQMDELLKELFRAYSELSEETRTKIPLKQIWAPLAVDAS